MNKWNNYLFHRDFTAHAAALASVGQGPLSESDQQALANILADVDQGEGKDSWLTAQPGEAWSLAGTEVVHNGLNQRSFPTKSTRANVLILQFPESSIAPQNRIYLQYD